MDTPYLNSPRLRRVLLYVATLASACVLIYATVSIWDTYYVRGELSTAQVIVILTGFATLGFVIPLGLLYVVIGLTEIIKGLLSRVKASGSAAAV